MTKQLTKLLQIFGDYNSKFYNKSKPYTTFSSYQNGNGIITTFNYLNKSEEIYFDFFLRAETWNSSIRECIKKIILELNHAIKYFTLDSECIDDVKMEYSINQNNELLIELKLGYSNDNIKCKFSNTYRGIYDEALKLEKINAISKLEEFKKIFEDVLQEESPITT